MAPRIRIILATAIVVALAASMALPAAAHHKDGHDGGQEQASGQGQAQGKNEGKGQGRASGQGQGESQGKASGQGQGEGQGKSQGKGQGRASGQGQGESQGKASGQGQGQGQKARGTVKIRSTGVADGDHRNEPHPGCIFWAHYWGFDEREVVATFRAHPPTGGNRDVLQTDTVQLPGPEQTVSGSYDLAPIFEGLGIEPHHRQGYHVKLQVTSTDGRHLTKHKVFWIDCPAQVLGEDVGAEELGVPPGEEVGVPPGEEVGAEEIALGEREAVPPEVLGVIHERAQPEVQDARVAAAAEEAEARPGVLPVTGASLLIFLLAGLALIGAGANLYRARRG